MIKPKVSKRHKTTNRKSPRDGSRQAEFPASASATCKNGILVTRKGEGLTNHKYSDPNHRHLAPKHEEYAKSLGIPPNYPSVDVCKKEDKVLYVAKDQKGRTQTVYTDAHKRYREDVVKPSHMLRLTPGVWKQLMEHVDKAIKKEKWTPDKLAATAVLLIQTCFFRPGSRPAHGEDAHFGVVTLLVKHVEHADDDECKFVFVGKSAKTNTCSVGVQPQQKKLCKLLKQLTRVNGANGRRKREGDRLFRAGGHTLRVDHLRSFLREATEPKGLVKPKDIRTYYANIAFLRAFSQTPIGSTKKSASARVHAAITKTAEQLNNTKQVAQSSYILAPLLKAAFEGELDDIPVAADGHARFLHGFLKSLKLPAVTV